MRDISDITEIIVHCADTKTSQDFSVEDIRRWHVEGNGWSDIGYHYYIKLNGDIFLGRSIQKAGAHCFGHNDELGVCFEGGKFDNGEPWSEPMAGQLKAFKKLKDGLDITLGKNLIVKGHYEYDKGKTCPNFDVNILK